MLVDVEIKNFENLTLDLYYNRLSFSHILYQSFYSDIKLYLKIYTNDLEKRKLVLQKDVYKEFLITIENSKSEFINLIKLVKMYNQKRFKNVENVDSFIYLLVSKLKSFIDLDGKILYSKEMIVTVDKYFKLINRLNSYLNELCPDFTNINVKNIENKIINSASRFSLDDVKSSTLKGYRLNKFPNVDIVHSVSGFDNRLIFIKNSEGYFVVLKESIENYIPLAYTLVLTNDFVSDNLLERCQLENNTLETIHMNETIVNYINDNKSIDLSNNKIKIIGVKLETLLHTLNVEKIDIKKELFKNNDIVFSSYQTTMQLAKRLLLEPKGNSESIINRVDAFIDNLTLKIERLKKEIKLKEHYKNSVRINGMNISKVPLEFRDYTMCLDAVRNNGFAIDFIVNPDEKLILEAIKQNPKALSLIESKYKTLEICNMAYILDKSMKDYIPNKLLLDIES